MNQNEILKIFEEKNALLTGHFLLSSGLHSDRYVQCAQVLQYPAAAEKLAKELASNLKSQISNFKIDLVVSPAMGGVIIGQEIGRALGVKAIFTERENVVMTLRRGFKITKGEKAIIVEDVITTGKSTKEVAEVVKNLGGEIVAAVSLIDRTGGGANFSFPQISLLKLEIKTYQSNNCPLCKQGSIAVKPGSRGLVSHILPSE
ncbi:MAG: orotate phosphoribosyltransferase [Elusimicrobia bacterium]|nr:orotate phosphoribosyltransferase [Elusimicrobiota bacterium]MBU2614082.1 orotate phosphoribosyltransferase [Elusimicrobiota bacterium]